MGLADSGSNSNGWPTGTVSIQISKLGEVGQFVCSRIGRIEKVDFRFPIHYSTGCVCWIPFLSSVGSSLSFLFVFVIFLGAFDARELGRRKLVLNCLVFLLEVCNELLSVLKHVLVAPFPRAKRSFGARGALTPFIVAVVALDFVESRQREHICSYLMQQRCCKKGHR